MLTKWLPRHTFEKYRNTVLNLRAHRKLGIPVDCTSAPVTVCSSTCRREQEGVLLAGCWRVATPMRACERGVNGQRVLCGGFVL